MMGADPTIINTNGMSAREEAKGDAIDVYFVYDYNGVAGLLEKYPQYSKLAKIEKITKRSMRIERGLVVVLLIRLFILFVVFSFFLSFSRLVDSLPSHVLESKPIKSSSIGRDKEADKDKDKDKDSKKESRSQLRAVTSTGNVRIDTGLNPKDSDSGSKRSTIAFIYHSSELN
jgi:hypothetical protein